MEDKKTEEKGDPVVVCRICDSELEVLATTCSHYSVNKEGDINWDVDLSVNNPDTTTYEVYCTQNINHVTGYRIDALGGLVLITEEDPKEEEKSV